MDFPSEELLKALANLTNVAGLESFWALSYFKLNLVAFNQGFESR